MAVLKFRVYWDDDESIYRDVAITHRHNFFDLHDIILKSYEFDSKHAATFYRSNDNWQKGRQISLEKYDRVYKAEPMIMNDTILGSEVHDPNQKFLYVYDFHKNWTFMVELIHINKDEDPNMQYPSILRSEGIAPSQYGTKGLVNEKLAEIEEKYDINNSILGEKIRDGGENSDGTEEESDEEED